MPVSAIILAAGSSSRMGSSKQLLRWGEGTLLTHAINTAMNSHAGHVFVVLGNNEAEHRKAIKDLPVTVVSNPKWANGMGSSLKAGLAEAQDVSEGVIVMVCDQPFVTSDHLNHLIENFIKTGMPIAASKYDEIIGVPALFSKEMFSELMAIGDDEGAKKVIAAHEEQTALVYLIGSNDIDTYEDYLKSVKGG